MDERQLSLATYHEAFGEFERYYRLLPEIHQIEGESAVEIRRLLRNQYVYGQQAQPVAV